MRIFDVIQHSFSSNEILHRIQTNDIRTFSSLIVTEGQVAVFLKNGAIVQTYTAGRYTLKTDIIPVLEKIVNLVYSSSPYNAEVIFIKTTNIMGVRWGTSKPIQARDKEFKIPIEMVGYGVFGFKITNFEKYIKNFVGDATQQTTLNIYNILQTNIYQIFTKELTAALAKDNLSGLDVSSLIETISDNVSARMPNIFVDNGIEIINFSIESLTLTDEVTEILTNILSKKLELDTLGDKYEMVKKLDALNNFSMKENVENGGGNNIADLIVTANIMKDYFGNSNETNNQNNSNNNTATPLFYFIIDNNGNKSKPLTFNKVKSMIESNELNKDNLVFYNGLEDYVELSNCDKFNNLFNN